MLARPRPEGAASIFAFFVVRALRTRGVGRQAALQPLRSGPGAWAITFQEVNAALLGSGVESPRLPWARPGTRRPARSPPPPANLPDGPWDRL